MKPESEDVTRSETCKTQTRGCLHCETRPPQRTTMLQSRHRWSPPSLKLLPWTKKREVANRSSGCRGVRRSRGRRPREREREREICAEKRELGRRWIVIRAHELGILYGLGSVNNRGQNPIYCLDPSRSEAKSLMLVAFLKIWKLILPLWPRFS